MGVLHPPGLKVNVEVPDDQESRYMEQGWTRAVPSAPAPEKPRRRRSAASDD